MRHIQAGQLDDTLRSHFDILYRPKRLFGKSPETVRLYGFTFDYFAAFLGREATLADLTDDNVRACMEYIVNERELSLRSANKTRDQLCALWNFLARKGVVKDWPDVPSFPEPKRTPIGWTASQLNELWRMCAGQHGTVCGIPANLWWLGIHSVMWDSLERIGAARFLRWDGVTDLDQQRAFGHFPAEIRKGRVEPSDVRFHADTTLILREMRAIATDEYVFPWHKDKTYLHTRYRTLREKWGLPVDRWHSFHCIRRTGSSFAEAAGGDPTKLLRHSSRRIYEQHYRVPQISGEKQASDILFRPSARADLPEPPRAA